MSKRSNTIIFYCLVVGVLGGFLLAPLAGVFGRAFWFTGTFDPSLFLLTLASPIVQTACTNSILLAFLSLAMAFFIAVPLAFIVSRYTFFSRSLFSVLVLIPMMLPPFVGAIGMTRMFGQYGFINLFFGLGPIPWLTSANIVVVALLQALHLFPILYLNISSSLSQINPELLEAARTSGAKNARVLSDIVLPLAMPGIAAGAILVFLWSLTDLGTPLLMGFRNVLAVEIFERTVSINTDPSGSILVIILMLTTIFLVLIFKKFFAFETATPSRGQRTVSLKQPSLPANILMSVFMWCVVTASILPHCGIILTSLAEKWYFTALPTEWSFRFFGSALSAQGMQHAVQNSLLYSSVATLVDVILGTYFAWMIARKKIRAAWAIDALIMLPMALPGIILAFGYIATFSGTFLDPLKNPIPLLIIGYSIRRLPFCFRSAYAGFLQTGPEFEEAGRVCGATPSTIGRTITLPLISAHLAAGALLAFLFAMLEVSESMVLAVKEQFFPLTRFIYALLGKIPDGEYVASALGVICMIILGSGIALASAIVGKQLGKMFRM